VLAAPEIVSCRSTPRNDEMILGLCILPSPALAKLRLSMDQWRLKINVFLPL